MQSQRAKSPHRINTRLETFLARRAANLKRQQHQQHQQQQQQQQKKHQHQQQQREKSLDVGESSFVVGDTFNDDDVDLASSLPPAVVDFYEQEACVQDDKSRSLFSKYKFCLLIVSHDRLYLTDNPPKNLDNYIMFEDIIDIRTHDDVPKFLDAKYVKSSLHISIKYWSKPSEAASVAAGDATGSKKQSLSELKKRIVEWKRALAYSKSLEDKAIEIELNTARLSSASGSPPFRFAGDTLTQHYQTMMMNTNRSSAPMDTSRTQKSVHFDADGDAGGGGGGDATARMADRYARLIELMDSERLAIDTARSMDDLTTAAAAKTTATTTATNDNDNSVNNMSSKRFDLHLSLPPTPRSNIDSMFAPSSARSTSQCSYVSKATMRSIEHANDEWTKRFIQDTDKKETKLDVYVLNGDSSLFQTLRLAHFYSKIRATLNYHEGNEYRQSASGMSSQRTTNTSATHVKSRHKASDAEMDKKLNELRLEMVANIDKLDVTSKLVDELLCATNTYSVIKKLFWNSDQFYKLLASQIVRYLPTSPANMRGGDESLVRRISEFDCCLGFVETLCVMFSETEFLRHRNEYLYSEKCRHLVQLVEALIGEPEQATTGATQSSLTRVFDEREQAELEKLARELTHTVSVTSVLLIWEIMHFLSLTSWTSEHYSLEQCCARIESSPKVLASFVQRLMHELDKMVNGSSTRSSSFDVSSISIVLSARDTVTVYKMLDFLAVVLDKSTSGTLRRILRDSYAEEFKYYYCEDKMRLRTFVCYPLVDDLLATARRIERHILQ